MQSTSRTASRRRSSLVATRRGGRAAIKTMVAATSMNAGCGMNQDTGTAASGKTRERSYVRFVNAPGRHKAATVMCWAGLSAARRVSRRCGMVEADCASVSGVGGRCDAVEHGAQQPGVEFGQLVRAVSASLGWR